MWVHNPKDPLDCTRYTGESFFILNYKGKNIEIILRDIFDESSRKLTDNPFYVTWKLDHIKKPEALKNIPDEEIVEVLKEALSVYGTQGIETSVPFENIIVKLKV